jgi:hypothetical protein
MGFLHVFLIAAFVHWLLSDRKKNEYSYED